MIQLPNRDDPIADSNNIAMRIFFGWMQTVSEAVDAVTPTDGIGSPEGVVFAKQKRYYFDTVGEDLYFKTTNETLNTGWIQIT
jgi:hypothetical protein